MFEFSIAKKYLIPKKKHLSVSLISLLSVIVISLVVWLVLIFLSITEGIEKAWVQKLTALNAPIRVTPTQHYYNSYYYLIDSISSASNYTLKSIREKAAAESSNPYLPDVDMEPPQLWPNPILDKEGKLVDPVKDVFGIAENLKLYSSDFEISGALLRLRLLRPDPFFSADVKQSFLTQVSYLNSFSETNPLLHKHILPPTIEDFNLLLFSAFHLGENALDDHPETLGNPRASENVRSLFNFFIPKKAELKQANAISTYLGGLAFSAQAVFERGQVHSILIGGKKSDGTLSFENGKALFTARDLKRYTIDAAVPIFFDVPLLLDVEVDTSSLNRAKTPREIELFFSGELQAYSFKGKIPLALVEIKEAEFTTHFDVMPEIPPPWVYFVKNRAFLPETPSMGSGVILPKNFRESGIRIGDIGYFSYGTSTAGSFQEQRLPIRICGFYDAGVMAIGARYILAHPELIHHINASGNFFSLDQNMQSGIGIWFDDLSQTKKIKELLKERVEKANLSPFWRISSYEDYDFAKELIQQFKSDKNLFTLIGVIILLVACCNIISLLTLLVNDKKKEIGVLQSMGASPKSIASIFALCGMMMGFISCLIGTGAAYLTLKNIDKVARFLSFIQGHEAFNKNFYGAALPNSMSHDAVIFIAIATPVIALLAGLIPALKASRLSPAEILRSE